MSIHPSLKIDSAGVQQRSVLTRIERIKGLMKKGAWSESQAVVGLPKTKILKIKAKKVVKEKEGEEGAAVGAKAPEAAKAAAKPAGKPAAKA
ncbi:MAG: small basic protein [Candidatus Omnitrophica bacterium]|nr:small basic protein [Candidatus Omnitrophota bacterium]